MPILMVLQERQPQLLAQPLQQLQTYQRLPVPILLLCWPARMHWQQQ